jgi:hypothetical protein
MSARKKQLANSLVRGLSSSAHQSNPFFPDLLKQPELLIIPTLGRMVVVFMYASPQKIGWRSALAWVEDLIEVKLNVGEYVITTALLFAEADDIAIAQDVYQLLSSVFEGFLLPQEWEPAFSDETLYEKLISLKQGHALDDFLYQEREQVSRALDRFGEERFARLVNKDREPEIPSRELKSVVSERLSLPTDAGLVRRPMVPNIKGHLGNLGRRYAFEFDLGISGRNDVVIKIIRAERYGSREKIRYLMAVARMLRYVVDGGKLFSRASDFHPILIVDGNLSGPDHDPYRYVRALLSVGWEIVGMDQIGALAKRLRHEHF